MAGELKARIEEAAAYVRALSPVPRITPTSGASVLRLRTNAAAASIRFFSSPAMPRTCSFRSSTVMAARSARDRAPDRCAS